MLRTGEKLRILLLVTPTSLKVLAIPLLKTGKLFGTSLLTLTRSDIPKRISVLLTNGGCLKEVFPPCKGPVATTIEPIQLFGFPQARKLKLR